RVRLMQLNLVDGKAKFGEGRTARSEDLPRQTPQDVVGAGATEIELRMAAPPRSVAKLDSLTGTIRAVGAPKMLEFQFAKPTGKTKQPQDGVSVQIRVAAQTEKSCSINLDLEHPPGAIVDAQSFEGPILHKFKYYRVWLSWNSGKNKMIPTAESYEGGGT